jgi:hypothetical protein
LPEQLAIEGHNAETNRLKALKDRAANVQKQAWLSPPNLSPSGNRSKEMDEGDLMNRLS